MNWGLVSAAERRAWIEEREWSPGGLQSILAEEAEANTASRRAPSAYGCRALALAVVAAPLIFVSALYALADFIANRWNPFL